MRPHAVPTLLLALCAGCSGGDPADGYDAGDTPSERDGAARDDGPGDTTRDPPDDDRSVDAHTDPDSEGGDRRDGDVDDPGSDTDTGGGPVVDIGESDADPDVDRADTTDDARQPGRYVIRGDVVHVGDLPEQPLLIALADSDERPATLVESFVVESATFPVLYQFDRLVEGDYHVVAFVDLAPTNDWLEPSEDDLIAVSSSVYVGPSRPLAPGIRVELKPPDLEE